MTWPVWLVKLGRWVASSRLVQALAVVGTFILYHVLKVKSAERKGHESGKEAAYEHVGNETRKQTEAMKERARETKDKHTDPDPDDVRRRLLDQATDRNDRP